MADEKTPNPAHEQTPTQAYKPHDVEARWQSAWLNEDGFHVAEGVTRPSFGVVMQPPGGADGFDIDQAANSVLQDILVRYRRMDGSNPLWLPATKCPDLAVQRLFDRLLELEGTSRPVLGKQRYLERVRRWRAESEERLHRQMLRLGLSCDWARERFSSDEDVSSAVRAAFVQLYRDGSIYYDEGFVFYCPCCQTALSELDVLPQEKQQKRAPECRQCRTEVVSRTSQQWFLRTKPLADAALRCVRDGRIRVFPEQYGDALIQALNAEGDWCISRQLWAGQPIPAWRCASCGALEVVAERPASCRSCQHDASAQVDDVIDAWFSYALWPLASLGWPQRPGVLEAFYPSPVQIAGSDLLARWVARSLMLCLRLRGDVPSRSIYVRPPVNSPGGPGSERPGAPAVDPVAWMAAYGADATRWAIVSALGRKENDAPGENQLEKAGRLLAGLWDSVQIALKHIDAFRLEEDTLPEDAFSLADRWILQRVRATVAVVRRCLDIYRFDEAVLLLERFIWTDVFDRYLELVKPVLARDGIRMTKQAVSATLAEVLDYLCRLLHPFVPAISEEIYHHLPGAEGHLIRARYPRADMIPPDDDVEGDMEKLEAIRDWVGRSKQTMGLSDRDHVHVVAKTLDEDLTGWLWEVRSTLEAMLGDDTLVVAGTPAAKEDSRVGACVPFHVEDGAETRLAADHSPDVSTVIFGVALTLSDTPCK